MTAGITMEEINMSKAFERRLQKINQNLLACRILLRSFMRSV